MPHQVAHQADERQVHRIPGGFPQGHHLVVVGAVEVVEMVDPAAGVEGLRRAGRIRPRHRGFQHRGERGVLMAEQVFAHPLHQHVLVRDPEFLQLLA